MDHIGRQLLLQAVLIFFNAFFAMTEIAVISLNPAKLRRMAEEGDAKAGRLLKMVETPAGFLSTIQIGITLAGFLGSAFAADSFSEYLVDWVYEDLGFRALSPGTLDALAVIVIIAVIIAYLVVRRPSGMSHTVDTISMLPYIMPGAVIGIALIIAFNTKYFSLTGTMAIMVIALAIRRMPYTSRSATATMMQIPISTEEAAISLGASKIKTFIKVTVPQMTSGFVSGAILSFVSIITEMSSGIFLYNNSTITLTLSTYNAITLGSYGTASAFATVTTLLTIVCLVLYLVCTRGSEKMSV